MEITSIDGVQWHRGGPNNMIDSGHFSTLSYAESDFGDSIVDTSRTDTSSEGYEVAYQHDCDQESHHLAAQFSHSQGESVYDEE
jgi:hypothetical protein